MPDLNDLLALAADQAEPAIVFIPDPELALLIDQSDRLSEDLERRLEDSRDLLRRLSNELCRRLPPVDDGGKGKVFDLPDGPTAFFVEASPGDVLVLKRVRLATPPDPQP